MKTLKAFLIWTLGLIVPACANASNSGSVLSVRIFSEPVIWTASNPPDEAETSELMEIASRVREAMEHPGVVTTREVNGKVTPASWRPAPVDYSGLEGFIIRHPDSAWAPSLRANLGFVYRKQGRYTLALEHWEKAWAGTKALEGDGKRVADFALAHWTSLLASLGRVDTLKKIFEEAKDRPLGGHLRQMFDSAKEGYQSMLSRPGYSFQCGTYALHSVATALGRTNFLLATGTDSPAVKLLNVHSPRRGFTLKALADLAATNALDLVAVKRTASSKIPVPSVVHWRQNHYAAIVFQQDDNYRVVDPTFGEPTWLTADAINAEASGYFLVPRENMPAGWQIPAENELLMVHGKGAPNHIKDENDQHNCEMPGSNGVECNTNCTGMVRWWVSEPYITLWLEDEPLGYQPSRGPRVSFHLSFKGRNTRPTSQFGFGFGTGWECSWISGIGVDAFFATDMGSQTNVTFDAVIYLPGGGVQRASAIDQSIESVSEMSNFFSQTRLVPILDASLEPIGWERHFPNGAKDVYQIAYFGNHQRNFLLAARFDPLGNATSFQYDGSWRLTKVFDVDGRTNVLTYGTNGPSSGDRLITTVTDAFGRPTQLNYMYGAVLGQWFLTNMVDPEGVFSQFAVNALTGQLNYYNTTHGGVGFGYGGAASGEDLGVSGVARRITVSDAGRTHVYMYRDDSSGLVPNSYFDAPAGASTPIGTVENSNMHFRNSFYWDPAQVLVLSTNEPNLTMFDYRKGRMRHWLHLPGSSPLRVGSTLSFERGPSTDINGFGEGRRIWYDYPNKQNNNPNYEGSSGLPGLIAWRDAGTIYYKWFRRNGLGRPTNVVETWSEVAGGPQLLRTNIFRYAANGIDLLEWIGPNGEALARMEYNATHQLTRHTNVFDNEVTVLTYNPLRQIQQIDFPNGVSRAYTYNGSGAFPNWLQRIDELPTGAHNSFVYTNGVISQWTDSRNRTLHFGWDKLQRIVRAEFPDSTYVSNIFAGLNLVGTRDRLGRWMRFKYWPTRELNIVTNALGANGGVTTLDWCACGALEKVTDGLGQETEFLYDNAGRVTRRWDDEVSLDYGHDLFGRLTAITKGYSAPILTRSFAYTLHGLPARVTTDTNLTYAVRYDNRDRPIWFTNAPGLAFTNAYDDLDRLIARGWPDGSTESFTYTTNGLVAFTNRLGFATRMFRDFANRTLWVTNANTNVLKFVYSPAGDLVSFTDGKNQTTTWTYDIHGNMLTNTIAGTDVLRLTYDAGDRVTNRWTPAGSNTVYVYNALDSLKNIIYPDGLTDDITFAYDALQRLTNMVDGIGAHAFTWSQRGNLLSENGPWQKDTVFYDFFNDLRISLSLQQSNAPAWALTNAYDAAHRLTNIVTPSGRYTYEYFPGVGTGGFDSDLVQRLALPSGSTITNEYDPLAQLAKSEMNGPGVLNRHYYGYDSGGQRSFASFTPKDHWMLTNDPSGRLISAQPQYNGPSYPHEKRSGPMTARITSHPALAAG